MVVYATLQLVINNTWEVEGISCDSETVNLLVVLFEKSLAASIAYCGFQLGDNLPSFYYQPLGFNVYYYNAKQVSERAGILNITKNATYLLYYYTADYTTYYDSEIILGNPVGIEIIGNTNIPPLMRYLKMGNAMTNPFWYLPKNANIIYPSSLAVNCNLDGNMPSNMVYYAEIIFKKIVVVGAICTGYNSSPMIVKKYKLTGKMSSTQYIAGLKMISTSTNNYTVGIYLRNITQIKNVIPRSGGLTCAGQCCGRVVLKKIECVDDNTLLWIWY